MTDISFPYRRGASLAPGAARQLRAAKDVFTAKIIEISADKGVRSSAVFVITMVGMRTFADILFYYTTPRAVVAQFLAGAAGLLAAGVGANGVRRLTTPKNSTPGGAEALAAAGGMEVAMQATSRLMLG